MDKDFHRTFTKCPCCGGEDRFMEKLGEELKAKGMAREEWNFHLDIKQGVVIDSAMANSIPIGSEVPGYGFMTDICMDCGCIYAIDLLRNDAKSRIDLTSPMPNRGQRRRDAREQSKLFHPFSRS